MSLSTLLSPDHLVSTFGLVGIIFIIFAETGLLIGFFFPGDSLLFLAGAYAATSKPGIPHIALVSLLLGVAFAAVVGGQVGYLIGRFGGERLFSNPSSKILKPKYIERTREFLERYGETKAVLLARVIPIVRTFINPVVGAIQMPVRKFIIANVLGGLIWSLGITMLGYSLGSSINIDKYILPITAVIILASLIPVILEYRKHQRSKKLS
jgi:membrane-associated protein